MKELTIYFGKKNDSPLGWGSTADTIKCNIQDELEAIHDFTTKKWVKVGLENGSKFINTDNILWFDIVDKKPTDNKEEKGGQE